MARRRNIMCWIASHEYQLQRRSEQDGSMWVCHRCGKVTYDLGRTPFSAGFGGWG